jgi:hypothetical protein|tara:strand:- start:456 stop:992 length:537 start_codon:yes stop_codon:yes gene_type:complete
MVDINKSLLNKNNFRLLIDKVPTVEYYVQSVNIPGLQFTEVNQPFGIGVDAFFPGDKVTFDALSVTFLVDEDLENFKEMYDWMQAIVPVSSSSDFQEYVDSQKTTTGELSNINSDLNQYSQITLITNTNKNIPNKYFRFYDCFPISLGGLELLSGSESETVTCTAEFRFTYYDIKTTS